MSKPRVSMPAEHKASGNVLRDSVFSLVPATLDSYSELNRAIWFDGPLNAAELEMVRLRNARKVGCVFCKAVRYDIATEAGLDEARIQQIDDNYASSALSEREKIILEFCDQYLDDKGAMSVDFRQRLEKILSAKEIAHLSVALAMFNVMSRAAVAFGGMPEDDLPPMAISVPE